MSTTAAPTTTANNTGRTCDANELVTFLRRTGIALNVGLRNVIDCGNGIQGQVGTKRGRKLLVRLNDLDTFDIEVGHLTNRFDWVVDAQTFNVHIDSLPAAIIALVEGRI